MTQQVQTKALNGQAESVHTLNFVNNDGPLRMNSSDENRVLGRKRKMEAGGSGAVENQSLLVSVGSDLSGSIARFSGRRDLSALEMEAVHALASVSPLSSGNRARANSHMEPLETSRGVASNLYLGPSSYPVIAPASMALGSIGWDMTSFGNLNEKVGMIFNSSQPNVTCNMEQPNPKRPRSYSVPAPGPFTLSPDSVPFGAFIAAQLQDLAQVRNLVSEGLCPTDLPKKYTRLYNKDGRVGIYTREQRRKIIEKFIEKRRKRVWFKTVRYSCRKNLANTRVRVKGRFVSSKKNKDQRIPSTQPATPVSTTASTISTISTPWTTSSSVSSTVDQSPIANRMRSNSA